MKRFVLILACCLFLLGCSRQEKDNALLHREFYQSVWERFDYVKDVIEVQEGTTYDLTMKIVFTDDYPFQDISMVFTIFNSDGDPYRAKGYKFKLKDADDHWNCEKADGCYTFVLPINKALQITEAGQYTFQIENKMPITPLVGVKELTLLRN